MRRGADTPTTYVDRRRAGGADPRLAAVVEAPAVTWRSPKPGTNAVEIAQRVIDRFHQLQGIYIPDGINVQVTRNYGATADARRRTDQQKAGVCNRIGGPAGSWHWAGAGGVIVGSAVVVTLAITLFASWAWGFTLNRVSLFALIFSIGILVDDAIVVVENIHQHLSMGAKRLLDTIPRQSTGRRSDHPGDLR